MADERIDRALQGDEDAARQLMEAYYPNVIRIVRAHLPSRTLEEDLAQEIFVKVFRNLGSYEAKVPLEHWIARIAVRTCIDRIRYEKRRPEMRFGDLRNEEHATLIELGEPSHEPRPDRASAAKELVVKLLRCLKPEDRFVLVSLDMEGWSVKEVCERTGWRESMVKVRAFRARQRLRRELERLEAGR